jgi:hypothetical protein
MHALSTSTSITQGWYVYDVDLLMSDSLSPLVGERDLCEGTPISEPLRLGHVANHVIAQMIFLTLKDC